MKKTLATLLLIGSAFPAVGQDVTLCEGYGGISSPSSRPTAPMANPMKSDLPNPLVDDVEEEQPVTQSCPTDPISLVGYVAKGNTYFNNRDWKAAIEHYSLAYSYFNEYDPCDTSVDVSGSVIGHQSYGAVFFNEEETIAEKAAALARGMAFCFDHLERPYDAAEWYQVSARNFAIAPETQHVALRYSFLAATSQLIGDVPCYAPCLSNIHEGLESLQRALDVEEYAASRENVITTYLQETNFGNLCKSITVALKKRWEDEPAVSSFYGKKEEYLRLMKEFEKYEKLFRGWEERF